MIPPPGTFVYHGESRSASLVLSVDTRTRTMVWLQMDYGNVHHLVVTRFQKGFCVNDLLISTETVLLP